MFVVHKGNPKGIKDWGDLVKPGVAVITPNPKTSGGARWNYLAAYGYALDQFGGDETKAKACLSQLFRNVPVLDTGARGSTTTFAQRGLGDVLITWENEALPGPQRVRRRQVRDRGAAQEHPGRAAGGRGRRNVDAKGTRKVAEEYLRLPLFARTARRSPPSIIYRPVDPQYAAAEDMARFPKIELFGIDTLRRLEEGPGPALR